MLAAAKTLARAGIRQQGRAAWFAPLLRLRRLRAAGPGERLEALEGRPEGRRGMLRASVVPAALARVRTTLRRRLAGAVVECGIEPCRRFHLDHAWLRRVPGIYLGARWYCSPACFRDAVEREVRDQAALRYEGGRRLPRMPWRLILLTRGEVTEAQLEQARAELASGGLQERGASPGAAAAPLVSGYIEDDLGAVLVRLGFASEKQVAEARAAEAGCSVYPGGGPALPHAPRHARSLLPPAALLEQYQAVVVHLDRRGGRLVLGCVLRQEPALLRAVAEVTGLRTEGCFVTPSEYARLRAAGTRPGAGAAAYDAGAEVADDPLAITELIVDQAVRSAAEQVHLARLGDRLWLRLSGARGARISSRNAKDAADWATDRAADRPTGRIADRIFTLRPQPATPAPRVAERVMARSTAGVADPSRPAPPWTAEHRGASIAAAAARRQAGFPDAGRKLRPL